MICPICKIRPKGKHHNAKYCKPCAVQRRKKPRTTLNEFQKRKVRKLAGKVPQVEIQKMLGVCKASLQRFARDEGFQYRFPKYKKKTIDQVIDYYVKHGKVKTQERFPKVKIRSIIERYAHIPRQRKWTDKELLELPRMAGIISMGAQARYFNRPNAHRGSIQSAWMKKFHHGGSSMNGLSWNIAKHYVRPFCPVLQTEFWRQRENSKRGLSFSRGIILWIDLYEYLRPEVPEHLRSAIKTLAKFQKWLHGPNIKNKIETMIERIEHGREVFTN